MNVYLYQSWTEKELKNAYIGKVYEYSYDFRGKTTTNLTNDGWTYTNTPSIDANWVYYSSWACYLTHSLVSFNNAKKITIDAQFQVWLDTRWSVWLWTSISNWENNWFYADQTPSRQVQLNSATITDERTSIQSWTRTIHIEYDLVNKTYLYTWFIEQSWTLTDTQIANIKTNNTLRIIVANPWERFQTIKILVE